MVRRLSAMLTAALVAATLVAPGASGTAAIAQPAEDPDLATLERLAGPGRIQTAVAVAQEGWDAAETVVVASAEDYPDALAGAALAATLDAPILLTERTRLSPDVRAEVRRLDPDEVVVLGGTAAVSSAVRAALNADGYRTTRLAGSTRFGTAAAVSLAAGAPTGEVVVASGVNFPDALAAGALAGGDEPLPTLLTAPRSLSAEAEEALEDLEAERVYVLGGAGAVAPAVVERLEGLGYDVERLGGPTRYDTAALVAGEALQRRGGRTLALVAATGDRFPDALSAAAFADRRDGLLVLVPTGSLAGAPRVARLIGLSGERFDAGYAIGGTAAISAGVAEGLEALINAPAPERVPVATGTGGAAATVTPLATEAALLTLAGGGNAVDATVAAAGVLGVVQPYSAGIGGGGFMVIRTADGELTTIDSREEAPAAFTNEVYLDDEGAAIPFEERVISGLGVGVPGTVAGWDLALEQYGSMPLAALLQPGLEYARYGFPLDPTLATQTAANEAKFSTFTSTSEIYLRGGRVPVAGDWLRNPDLADTYGAIAAGGPAAFYTGEIAADLVAAVTDPPVAPDSERTVRPSPMTVEDVAEYEAIEREPVVSTFRDVTVVGMGLPSSGGLTNALALNMLETFDEGADRDEVLHRYLESLRLAWADRNGFMGDTAFVDVPVAGLLSEDYAADRAALIGPTASDEQRQPGNPWAYQDGDGGASGMVATAVDGSTTHLTVADADGTVVAYTFTIESIGGSGIVVPGRGFLLNNELTDFDPVPPHPNEPAGGKRPRSSMAPTIVLQDGEPLLALGTPGGATIITTVLQIVVDVVENGRSLPDALAAPRISNFNSATLASNAEAQFFGTDAHAALEARGHTFNQVGEQGAATGIVFGDDGAMTAVAEPVRRGAGSAGVLDPVGGIVNP